MERMTFRSTSILGLQAELHQRDLLDEARQARITASHRPRRPTILGLRVPFIGNRAQR